MGSRPSEPLLKILLQAARKKGWNTATLAQAAQIERGRLKLVLSGREPMTVDELISLSGAMELNPVDLGLNLPADLAPAPTTEPTGPVALPKATAAANRPDFPDPFDIHAKQIVQVGFALGCDIFFTAQTERLQNSGVPAAVLERFQPNLPIRLESVYHRHNDPQYLPDGLQLRLSFDAVYTCLFPWDAIKQITLFPLAPPELEPEPEPPPESGSGRKVGHLRVIE